VWRTLLRESKPQISEKQKQIFFAEGQEFARRARRANHRVMKSIEVPAAQGFAAVYQFQDQQVRRRPE